MRELDMLVIMLREPDHQQAQQQARHCCRPFNRQRFPVRRVGKTHVLLHRFEGDLDAPPVGIELQDV